MAPKKSLAIILLAKRANMTMNFIRERRYSAEYIEHMKFFIIYLKGLGEAQNMS